MITLDFASSDTDPLIFQDQIHFARGKQTSPSGARLINQKHLQSSIKVSSYDYAVFNIPESISQQ